MAMMKNKVGVTLMALLVILVVVDLPRTAEAVTCSPIALSPCMAAASSSSPPSSECCEKLKEQKPCLCGYLKNPILRQYVNSPGAKKVASSCGVPFPTC